MRRLIYLIAVARAGRAVHGGRAVRHDRVPPEGVRQLELGPVARRRRRKTGAVRLTSPQSAPDPGACFDGCGRRVPGLDARRLADLLRLELGAVHPHLVDQAGRDRRASRRRSAPASTASSRSRPDGSMLAYDYSDNEDPGLSGIYVAPSTGGGAPRPADGLSEAGVRHQPRLLAGRQAGRVPARPVQRVPAEGLRPQGRDRVHRLDLGRRHRRQPACTGSSAAVRSGATRTTARTARAS